MRTRSEEQNRIEWKLLYLKFAHGLVLLTFALHNNNIIKIFSNSADPAAIVVHT